MTKPVDLYAAIDLANNMLGMQTVGVTCDGEEVEKPISPCIRAHLVAALGCQCPSNLWASYTNGAVRTHGRLHAVGIKPFADYLRGMADALDPAEPSI